MTPHTAPGSQWILKEKEDRIGIEKKNKEKRKKAGKGEKKERERRKRSKKEKKQRGWRIGDARCSWSLRRDRFREERCQRSDAECRSTSEQKPELKTDNVAWLRGEGLPSMSWAARRVGGWAGGPGLPGGSLYSVSEHLD